MNKSMEFSNFVRHALHQAVCEYPALVTGSVAELPFQYIITNVSDIDFMLILKNHVAVSSTEEIPVHFRANAYIIETIDVHPGFARLR